jgi:hypothetical protein
VVESREANYWLACQKFYLDIIFVEESWLGKWYGNSTVASGWQRALTPLFKIFVLASFVCEKFDKKTLSRNSITKTGSLNQTKTQKFFRGAIGNVLEFS